MTGDTSPAVPAGGRRWWRRAPVAVAGLGVAGVGLGIGLGVGTLGTAAAAGTGGSTPAAGSPPVVHPRPRLGPAGGGIHGQFVVPKRGGGYRTVDTQVGTVTSVSSSSITLKSQDGFSKTYQVTPTTVVDAGRDGIGDVKTGNTARVLAVATGTTANAVAIADQTTLRAAGAPFLPPGRRAWAPQTGAVHGARASAATRSWSPITGSAPTATTSSA